MRFGMSTSELHEWMQTPRLRFALVAHTCWGDAILGINGCQRKFWLERGMKRGYAWRTCRPCYEGREKKPRVCDEGRVHV